MDEKGGGGGGSLAACDPMPTGSHTTFEGFIKMCDNGIVKIAKQIKNNNQDIVGDKYVSDVMSTFVLKLELNAMHGKSIIVF